MNGAGKIAVLVKKDLLLEGRQQYSFYGILLYVAATTFVLYLAVDEPQGGVWNGLYWVLQLFICTNAVAKSFLGESRGRMLYFQKRMERVTALIEKLAQQHRQGATAEQLLMTIQLLQLELQTTAVAQRPVKTGKVAVVMPTHFVPAAAQQPLSQQTPPPQLPRISIAERDKKYLPADAVVKNEEAKPIPAVEEKKLAPVTLAKEHYGVALHDMDEAPTLMQHTPVKQSVIPTAKELHEALAVKKESLNDKLKENKKELSHHLASGPIKDLRKGVGINDRFLFVNELFRGDEAMYERSIKTINAFHILPEAEYWINRELKVKLGWNDNKDAVQQFYAIVRRRFA